MSEDVKRLYRSMSDRMLFGICGGLGEYLNMDSTVLRLLALTLLFITGPGVLVAYLVFALAVPEARAKEIA